jgi:predicted dehydrogenase
VKGGQHAGLFPTHVSCMLATFHKAPGDKVGEYVLDANDSATMQVRLENGAIGVVHASRFASGHLNDLTLQLFGTKGGLDVRLDGGVSKLRASLGDDMPKGIWVDVETPAVKTNYERFIAAIKGGTQVLPDFARGAALQKVLDLAVASDAADAVSLAV